MTTLSAPTSPRSARAATSARLPEDQALHLVRRITYGPTPALVHHVRAVGATAYFEAQLDPAGTTDPAAEAVAEAFPDLALEPAALRFLPRSRLRRELQAATLLRRWFSPHQLLETMVEFWTDHLHIDINGASEGYLKVVDDRDVVRPHALGRFDELLLASAASPAMLVYLDNATSRADGDHTPNENYARELLELHTVGVHGGYDEDDVATTARVLSGWGVDRSDGRFRFRSGRHGSTGHERVMNWYADGRTGLAAGEDLLRHLAHHPSTAAHLSTKLCRRFVADDPPESLVESTAATYLRHGTAIVPVLRHLLTSDEFAEAIGNKVRRPAGFLVAALRALDARPTTDADALVTVLTHGTDGMGHAPMSWGPPTGFPDVAEAWASSSGLLARWNVAQALVGPDRPGIVTRALSIDVVRLLDGSPSAATTMFDVVDRLADQMLGHALAEPERSAVARYLGAGEAPTARFRPDRHAGLLDQTAALVLQSPVFQLR